MADSKIIWCDTAFEPGDRQQLLAGIAPFQLVEAKQTTSSNLFAGGFDPVLAEAAIAFGQPDHKQVMDLPNLQWVHLTSAGYTRYDTAEFKSAMKSRGTLVTNSSAVFAEPCAEQAMAMILSMARRLPISLDNQRGSRSWPIEYIRDRCFRLADQSVLIYGFGSIARYLVKLLEPTGMKLTGVRRNPAGDEAVTVVTPQAADRLLADADHVVNLLPLSADTQKFFNAERLSRLSPHAFFYNIGRGDTVDQEALAKALHLKQIAGACLDVTTPEPLPADHALWSVPNCFISPHTAGGHRDQMIRLIAHFQANLARFKSGVFLLDRII